MLVAQPYVDRMSWLNISRFDYGNRMQTATHCKDFSELRGLHSLHQLTHNKKLLPVSGFRLSGNLKCRR
jgi:hypothetical protein